MGKKTTDLTPTECSIKTYEFCVYEVFTFCVTRCVHMKNKTSTKSRLLSIMINVVSLSRHVSWWFGNYFHWDLYTEIICIATPLPECYYIPRENYSQIVTFLVELRHRLYRLFVVRWITRYFDDLIRHRRFISEVLLLSTYHGDIFFPLPPSKK